MRGGAICVQEQRLVAVSQESSRQAQRAIEGGGDIIDADRKILEARGGSVHPDGIIATAIEPNDRRRKRATDGHVPERDRLVLGGGVSTPSVHIELIDITGRQEASLSRTSQIAEDQVIGLEGGDPLVGLEVIAFVPDIEET